MLRDYGIMIVFRQAMKRNVGGHYTLSKLDLLREPERLNWHYTLRTANKWIETHTTTFRYISPAEGKERVFHVFNPTGYI
ncbi:DNA polymerase V (plasmid) [Pantoea sp. JZ29]|nr:DNA polymerase V [Pantoea sp. JZ29]